MSSEEKKSEPLVWLEGFGKNKDQVVTLGVEKEKRGGRGKKSYGSQQDGRRFYLFQCHPICSIITQQILSNVNFFLNFSVNLFFDIPVKVLSFAPQVQIRGNGSSMSICKIMYIEESMRGQVLELTEITGNAFKYFLYRKKE